MGDGEIPRLNMATGRLQTGFQTHSSVPTRDPAVDLASPLADIYEDVEALEIDEQTTISQVRFSMDTDDLQTLRKIAEVVEDSLEVRVGHRKLARLATTAATLSSAASFGMAGWNLLVSSHSLDEAAAAAKSLKKVEKAHFTEFYRSLALFVIEAFLFTTPVPYKLAWRGTRYVNNKFLYHIRSVSTPVYRLVMSETHFAIRGAFKGLLRDPAKYTSFLVEVVTDTVEILRDHSDESLDQLVGKVETILGQFDTFVRSEYNISVPEVDIEGISQQVAIEFGAGEILNL